MFHWIKRWTKTEHELCQEELSAFLDGQLTRQERLRVQKHLEQCAVCRRDLTTLQQTVALLRATPVVKPPRSFFIPASEKVRQRQLQRTRLVYGYLRAATAMATVLLILVLSGDAFLRFATVAPARTMPAAVPETRMFGVEQTPMEQTQVLLAPPPAILLSVETPTAMPFAVGEAVPEQSPEPTAFAIVVPLTGGEMVPQGTAEVTSDSQAIGMKAVPSQTFARSAGAPAPPTASPESMATGALSAAAKQPTAVPTLETSVVPTETSEASDTLVLSSATPEPTDTVVLPTATPEPTSTPMPPTATLIPTQTHLLPTATPLPVETRVPAVGWPSPQLPLSKEGPVEGVMPASPGLWTILDAARQVLPWLEWALGALVALLLAITLWLRLALRSL